MIQLNLKNGTFVCPFCGHAQAYNFNRYVEQNGPNGNRTPIERQYQESSFAFFTLICSNDSCRKVSVTAINRSNEKQIDIVPKVVIKEYPDYIPEQIRKDYYEANLILEDSPRASATLLRRCLQGMIHDFWNIHEKNLNAEISCLKDKVSPMQWKAIDGIRSIGNIGAHMESDVNCIIDIEPHEAKKLLLLIDLLLDKWYIARHDEEQLFTDISEIADDKEKKRRK